MSKRIGQSDALPDGGSIEWPRPIYDRSWVDPSGTVWRMRGRPLGVLELDGEAQEAVLSRVEQYLAGDAPPHSLFEMGDFRDADRRAILVVQESC